MCVGDTHHVVQSHHIPHRDLANKTGRVQQVVVSLIADEPEDPPLVERGLEPTGIVDPRDGANLPAKPCERGRSVQCVGASIRGRSH